MGDTLNKHLLDISKTSWQYLLSKQITVTVEYLPSKLNGKADWESWNVEAKAEWKRLPTVSWQNLKRTGRTQSGLACVKTTPLASSVYSMETQPKHYSNKCRVTRNEQKFQSCLSPILYDKSNFTYSDQGRYRLASYCYSN